MAYFLGAIAAGEPIADPQRYAAAGQSVHDTRTLLAHGRGNVAADTAATQGYNGIVASVAELGMDIHNKLARAAVMGGGICDQYAGIAALAHVPHMREGETMAITGGMVDLAVVQHGSSQPSRAGHAWAELRASEGRRGDSTVVMDAWANGPAVRLKDSAWANATGLRYRLHGSQAEMAWHQDRVECLAPYVHPQEDEGVGRQLAWKTNHPTDWTQYKEAQVVSEEFASRARYGLSQMEPEHKAYWVSTASQLAYGLTDEKASSPQMQSAVLEQAYDLDQCGRPQATGADDS